MTDIDAIDAALAAVAAGAPCPCVPGLPDEYRDRFAREGRLGDWLAGRRAMLASVADLPVPKRTATGYALWSALSREQIGRCDVKDAGRLQARAQDRIPEDNPVVIRLAAQAGVALAAWFDTAAAA